VKHIVGFSGGADSQACAGWCLERFPPEDVILLNSDAGGNEHPITTEFIREYSGTVHPVMMIRPEIRDMGNRAKAKIAELGLQPTDPLTFDTLALLKGRYPSRKAQFCTEHLKLKPQLRWMADNRDLIGPEYERYNGVRRDESANRALVSEREYDDLFTCWLNRPLADWTKHQVFEFIASRGEPVNTLYTMGFSRVGCAPCINSSKEDIYNWAARFPEMIDKVRAWEQRVGRTFFPPCMPGKNGERVHGFIDEVVEWAKTTRGGRQYQLPILESDIAAGLCSSKWGLCE
jgi:3'-phosphoadenosine 5'-phosphosulfate sulfotransferase (PAPS reductase)/FAD synthetase